MLKLMMELKQIDVFYVTAHWYIHCIVLLGFPNLPIIRNSKFKNWSRIKIIGLAYEMRNVGNNKGWQVKH